MEGSGSVQNNADPQHWCFSLVKNYNKLDCNSRSEGGDATEEQLCEPGGLAVSADGTLLYIADTNNHCIRHCCCQLAEFSAS